MKKLFLVLSVAATAIVVTSCGNHAGSGSSNTDSSSTNVTKPADNNNATNPSLADTAYSNNKADSSGMKKDSSKMQH